MNSLEATSLCVKCGLCLPHCPTFQLTGIETESPRGRIGLIQALHVAGELPDGAEAHLASCLQCRACEAMCPSRVPFSRLMDDTRARIGGGTTRTPARALTTLSPLHKRGFARLAGLYRTSGLQALMRRLGLLTKRLRRFDRLLSRTPRVFEAADTDGGADARPVVHLFPGCIASILDADALDAAVRLLTAAGYRVEVADGTRCCGALHQHGGDTNTARTLAATNLALLETDSAQVITSVVSGCTAQLKDYPLLYPDTVPKAFGARVRDLHRLLLDAPGFERLRFAPLPATVALHLPCTQRNALKEVRAVEDLLRRVPQIALTVMGATPGCCGAGGDYSISHPAEADALLDGTLRPLAARPPDLLASSNIGCALHLAAGVEARGWPTEVLHPLTLLARQLRDAPPDLR